MENGLDQVLLHFSDNVGIVNLMNTRWVWPIVESLHFLGLCLLIGAVGVFDFRMLGVGKSIPLATLHRFIPLGVAGYCLNVATGTLFFLAAPDQYLYNPSFQMKMLFMAIAGSNMVIFYTTTAKTVKNTPANQTVIYRAQVIGLVSLIAWTGVITCGRLLTFYRPPYHWCFWCS